jgi:hypothetical protein
VRAISALIENRQERMFLKEGAKQLLENVYLQDRTIAYWYQLVWRMMKFKMDKAARSPMSAAPAKSGDPFFYEKADFHSLLPSRTGLLKKHREYRLKMNRPNWSELDILVNRHQQPAAGVLRMTVLTAEGRLLRRNSMDFATGIENDWVRWHFSPITNSLEQSFVVKLEFEGKGLQDMLGLHEEDVPVSGYRRLLRRMGLCFAGGALFCRTLSTK